MNAQVLTLPAVRENLDAVLDFVNVALTEGTCPVPTRSVIDLAVEEVFSNIARYAYQPLTGDVTLSVTLASSPSSVTITLRDGGVPYNPLQKPDPDITLPLSERAIGGLGIYLVKRSMDQVTYRYADGQNMLTLIKFY